MKLRLFSWAHDDLLAGRAFYEKQQAGLGAYFLDTLFSDIESLLIHAGLHAQHFGYFRALSNRFPFGTLGDRPRFLKNRGGRDAASSRFPPFRLPSVGGWRYRFFLRAMSLSFPRMAKALR
jgi:hypothetical protein